MQYPTAAVTLSPYIITQTPTPVVHAVSAANFIGYTAWTTSSGFTRACFPILWSSQTSSAYILPSYSL